MISYPRWKIALVAIVLAIGIFLAVPNLFGEEMHCSWRVTGRLSSTPIVRR
jgi:hypothetical protein